ncbi:calcium/sodium antiporter [Gimesia sp.]|uniref:calcium/sodium antiporter n=1 Tax=Gimesia sp. TaxID=2024833 RepID=UPI003A8EA2EE
MLLPIIAIIAGLALLIWSTDWFIDGAAAVSRYFGMSSLLIGMVVVGFGTSLPEMVVSVISAAEGNAGIALGNAYGSNITNIALILGLTALINPLTVNSKVLRKELPVLTGCTLLAAWQVWNGIISRLDAVVLLSVFALLVGWTIWQTIRNPSDELEAEMERELASNALPLRTAVIRLFVGLTLVVISSRILVWGAVELAHLFGVSDLLIGLTIVAIGTSLPELASSIIATRKGEYDIAVGNVIGSNLFNTLAVVGLAGVIQPISVDPSLFNRDILVMLSLTLSLFVLGFGWKGPGRINRIEGSFLLVCYFGYTYWLVRTAMM